ncbi:MAG: HD domain-containing phosphohydrolase, partial [Candidatus Humimicrobiaceae bacterium]
LERKSISSSIISSLERTLWEKSHETEEHANRLKHMALKLGNTTNLPESKLDELSLLSTLHDIGKIAIPENILIKKDKLTKKEWEIIKRHPEIGFNIASSSFQIKHMAEAILSHHERWDGAGYPQGLIGKDIPIISRILAIVDTYDVLTHARSYRKEIYKEEAAMEEIKRCSGTQFDPELVDKFIRIINDEILAKTEEKSFK